jgi:chemotaxis protein methyltransferase CheR
MATSLPNLTSALPAVMPSTGPKMSTQHFSQLRKIIYDRAGIFFPDNKQYVLESRLGQRLVELELDDYDTYIAFLTMGPYQVDEFQEMFNRITINETSFFRNEPQLEVFEKKILPKVLESRKATKRLRIWSAACSSGEEPYTLAMILHRTLGIRLADWRIEILGTDISEKMLEIAAKGVYGNYALRGTPAVPKTRYFKPEGQFFKLVPELMSMVNFELHNLKDRLAAKRHGIWDVIFCRNVMIYFDDEMKKQVLRMFADQLADDGHLFIGHSETIRHDDAPLLASMEPQSFCYTKQGVKPAIKAA